MNDILPALEDIPKLFSYKQIKTKVPSRAKHKVAHIHKSMRASNITEAAEGIAAEKQKKEEIKQVLELKKEEAKETF